MARRATGNVVPPKGDRRSWAIRFRAHGQRHFLALGRPENGWNRQRAEDELAVVMRMCASAFGSHRHQLHRPRLGPIRHSKSLPRSGLKEPRGNGGPARTKPAATDLSTCCSSLGGIRFRESPSKRSIATANTSCTNAKALRRNDGLSLRSHDLHGSLSAGLSPMDRSIERLVCWRQFSRLPSSTATSKAIPPGAVSDGSRNPRLRAAGCSASKSRRCLPQLRSWIKRLETATVAAGSLCLQSWCWRGCA